MYHDLVSKIKSSRSRYSRELVLVCRFDQELSKRVGDKEIYISEFVLAKILGYIPHLSGHPDVTREFLIGLTGYLKKPTQVLMRKERPQERYLICGNDDHRVVLEIKRDEDKTQINTIHLIKQEKIERLKKKCISL